MAAGSGQPDDDFVPGPSEPGARCHDPYLAPSRRHHGASGFEEVHSLITFEPR
jgi:hypothetical protein